MCYLSRSVEMLYIEVKLQGCGTGRHGDGMAAFMEVETSDNVTQIKEKVLAEMSLGLLTDNYKLFYNDIMLPDDGYLIDNNVQDFDSLTLKCFETGNSIGAMETVGQQKTSGMNSSKDSCSNVASVKGGRRGVYEGNTTNIENVDNKGSVSHSQQFMSMFKGMVQQVSSVGLCCWQSEVDFDDEYCNDRRNGRDIF